MKSLQRKSALIFILIFFSAFPAFCGGFGAAGAGALSFDEGKLQMAGGLCADYQPDGLPFIFEGEALFCQDFSNFLFVPFKIPFLGTLQPLPQPKD